jgi:D-serine deaminase-like pyridoxal phosphate-dependent protein
MTPATPYLRLVRDIVWRNLDRSAAYAAEHGLSIRPHTKTHKSLRIASWQLDRGAIGMTVAKPSEAEIMMAACDDLLLAYPIVDRARADRIVAVSRECDVKVAFDSSEANDCLAASAQAKGATIGVLIDLDVGLRRTGVRSPADALRLAECVDRTSSLELRGIFCYPGHVWNHAHEQGPPLQKVAALLEETLHGFTKGGLCANIVSGGSTPTMFQSHLVPQLTEIRPGTYLFNDMNTVHGGFADIADCGAAVIATVVSNAVPDQVVIDAGSKTLGADRCVPNPDAGHGFVLEHPEAKITVLSEEHGQIDVSRCPIRPRIGDQITVIPNHICPCINLQDFVWLQLPDGTLESLKVDARGRLT